MRRAGILYGAFVALGFTLMLLGPDAVALHQAFVHLWWGKLVLGLALILPLGMFFGWLAASARWPGISMLVWISGIALLVLVIGHLPFDGLSWLSSLTDPYPSAQPMYPFSIPSAAVTGISMVIGAGAGLFVGLLGSLALNIAWELSTRSHRLSIRSILILLLGLLPIVPLVPVVDNYIEAALRQAWVETQATVQTALHPELNRKTKMMETSRL